MYLELTLLLSEFHPVNAGLAMALFLGYEDQRLIFIARTSPDKSPDWVRALANGNTEQYQMVCKAARDDLMAEPGWCWLEKAGGAKV